MPVAAHPLEKEQIFRRANRFCIMTAHLHMYHLW